MSVTRSRPVRPRHRWIWVIVALVTAAFLIVPVALRFGLKALLHHEYGPVRVYHRPVTSVQVSAPGGTVAITAGRPGQVSVDSTLAWVFSKPAVRESWHGTTLAVSVRCAAPLQGRGRKQGTRVRVAGCSASLSLSVPADAEVRAAVGTGSATVTGLAGAVRVTATSGSLVLAYLSGPLQAVATSGSITGMTGLNVPAVIADVGSGSLALGLDSAPGSVSLAVGSGSGHVTVPPGTHYRFDADSGKAVHVSPGLSSPRAARLIAAKAGPGALSIVYPGWLPG